MPSMQHINGQFNGQLVTSNDPFTIPQNKGLLRTLPKFDPSFFPINDSNNNPERKGDVFTPSSALAAQLQDNLTKKSGSTDDIKDKETQNRLKQVPDYVAKLDQAHQTGDPDAVKLYNKYEPNIIISDVNTTSAPRYNPTTKDITVNATEDSKNRPEAGSVYYHEIGHFLDDKISPNSTRYASDNPKFGKALKADFEAYVTKHMAEKKVDRETAYKEISAMMKKNDADTYKGVSDIFGGLSEGKCQGLWGHSKDYWSKDPKVINNEAFANIFSAAMLGDDQIKHVKEMLPSSYAMFQEMIKKGAK